MSDYIATEKDIRPIIDDFDVFCQFIENTRPKLGQATGELGKKDCFALNASLAKPEPKPGPNYLQPAYPTINLFFYVSLAAGLFVKGINERNSAMFLSPSPMLERYRTLDPFARYLFLFRSFWTLADYNRLYAGSSRLRSPIGNAINAMDILRDTSPGKKIRLDYAAYFNCDHTMMRFICQFFLDMGPAARHLADFGFWQYKEAVVPELSRFRSGPSVKEVTPTRLGSVMFGACLRRRIEIYHERLDKNMIIDHCIDFDLAMKTMEDRRKGKLPKNLEPFERVFEPVFPAGAIDSKTLDAVLGTRRESAPRPKGNAYVFKVMFSQSVWRRIKLSSRHTMDDLHLAIHDAFATFTEDHLYAFFLDGKRWSPNAVCDPRTEKGPHADEAVIGELGLLKGQRILYLYDFGDEIRLDVKVEAILQEDVPPITPLILEKRGNPPELYSYWE